MIYKSILYTEGNICYCTCCNRSLVILIIIIFFLNNAVVTPKLGICQTYQAETSHYEQAHQGLAQDYILNNFCPLRFMAFPYKEKSLNSCIPESIRHTAFSLKYGMPWVTS